MKYNKKYSTVIEIAWNNMIITTTKSYETIGNSLEIIIYGYIYDLLYHVQAAIVTKGAVEVKLCRISLVISYWQSPMKNLYRDLRKENDKKDRNSRIATSATSFFRKTNKSYI